jgi:HEAT repeat protein
MISKNVEQPKTDRFRFGIKGLMVLVASFALIAWAGVRIWDTLEGDELLRQIRSSDVAQRRSAAMRLGTEMPDRDIDDTMAALVWALGDKDVEVRSQAAASLGALMQEFHRRVAGTDAEPAKTKARTDAAFRALVTLLTDGDPEARMAAATGLGRLVRPPHIAPMPAQVPALRDTSNAVRRETARLVYGAPDATAPLELLAALKDSSLAVRAAAARSIASFCPIPDSAIPALLQMLADAQVRPACIEALEAAWPTPDMVPSLVAALKSPSPEVRFRAAQLLGRIGPEAERSIAALIAILEQPINTETEMSNKRVVAWLWDPACAAAMALGEMQPSEEVLGALIKMLSSEIPERSSSAAEALGAFGPRAAAAVPALIATYDRVLKSKVHMNGQMEISDALGKVARSLPSAGDAIAILVRGLDSKDPLVQQGSARALGQFGAAAAPAVPRLKALAMASDPHVKEAARNALAMLGAAPEPDAGKRTIDGKSAP